MWKNVVLSIFSFSVLAQPLLANQADNKVIYGVDNRVEVQDYPEAKFREAALSVAGKIRNYQVWLDETEEFYGFDLLTAQRSMNLCEEERFSSQYTLPNCSGFLVAPDVLVTAGHCMQNAFDCKLSSWVFDFVKGVEKLPKENVFHCKEILSQEFVSKWYQIKDYAVIRLDRKVQDFRRPLKFRTKRRRVKPGTDLLVIGHPSGLPLKIADSAKVRPVNWVELLTPIRTLVRKQFYFLADLDTFGGNSGSPVFNKNTGEVEGILVQGADDYVNDTMRGCLVSAKRKNSTWTTAEKVFRINKVKKLKEIVNSSSQDD